MPRRPLTLLLAAPVIALGLAGCSLVPTPENIVEGLIEEAITQSGEDIDLDIDISGDGASLPAEWPGLPVPEGRVISASKFSDSFTLSIDVASEDAARVVIDELSASGFELTGETDYGEIKGAILTSDAWTIVYGWTSSGDDIIVSYTVSPTTS